MSGASKGPAKYKVTPLRQAQRELTRSRIRDAAGQLFRQQHYTAVTIEQIASSAGLRRSTVYLHYKDKSEILLDIITEYAPRAREMMARLAGPRPTRAQIESWVDEMLVFFDREQVALMILREVGRHVPDPAAAASADKVLDAVVTGLASTVEAFSSAVDPKKPNQFVRANAVFLIQSLVSACYYIRYGSEPELGAALRRVVVDAFESFIERSHAAPANKPGATRRKKAVPAE